MDDHKVSAPPLPLEQPVLPQGDDLQIKRIHLWIETTQISIAQLLVNFPDDQALAELMLTLSKIYQVKEFRPLQQMMSKLLQTEEIKQYQQKKRAMILSWLRPFRDLFETSPEKMNKREVLLAVKRVENLTRQRIYRRTELRLLKDTASYRVFNENIHPIFTSAHTHFWWSEETRALFHQIISKLIGMFVINMDERFLIFGSNESNLRFLVGFAHDAFHPDILQEHKNLPLHLKLIGKDEQEQVQEFGLDLWKNEPQQFFQQTKEPTLGFLRESCKLLDQEEPPKSFDRCFALWD